MDAKDITWEAIVIARPQRGYSTFDRYCWLVSSCDKCKKRIRILCKLTDIIRRHQIRIIEKQFDKE